MTDPSQSVKKKVSGETQVAPMTAHGEWHQQASLTDLLTFSTQLGSCHGIFSWWWCIYLHFPFFCQWVLSSTPYSFTCGGWIFGGSLLSKGGFQILINYPPKPHIHWARNVGMKECPDWGNGFLFGGSPLMRYSCWGQVAWYGSGEGIGQPSLSWLASLLSSWDSSLNAY